LATSSSGNHAPARGALLGGGALAAVAVYAVLTVVVLATMSVWGAPAASVAAFAAVATLAGALALAFVAPRLRHLRAAASVAEALADLRFDERAPATDDEFAALTISLNAAGTNIGSLVSRLRQERAQLEALLNASSDATVAVDAQGIITYMNDAASSLFSAAAGAALERPFIEAVRDHDLNDLLVSAATRGERSVRVVAYGPAQRWLQATAVPIEHGGAWAALAVFHDLTEVRRLDSMRRDFISNVSHELRTPLAGIRAAAETLQEGAIDGRPAAIEFVGHIQREVDRLTQLVEELLELSRIESGATPMTFTPVDVAELARASAGRFARQAERAGIAMRVEAPEEALVITGDSERLDRALGNLVANAIKFTDSGGSIVIHAALDGDSAVVGVTDTGIGIEPEERARVFERFYKSDKARGAGGTGLGLAIVKHIVLAHGGTVSVESRPGRGATFTMRLPLR
jgi:two-component system phosphate regulon sensor histidine kinase PhoR